MTEKQSRRLRINMRLLYAAQFVAIGAYLPFMPVWLAGRGLSAGEIGLVLTVPMLARAFVAPWVALAIDRRGDRRVALAVLAALSGVSTFTLYLCTGFPAILTDFLALGLFWCALMPMTEASAVAAMRVGRADYGRMRLWGSSRSPVIPTAAAQRTTTGNSRRGVSRVLLPSCRLERLTRFA